MRYLRPPPFTMPVLLTGTRRKIDDCHAVESSPTRRTLQIACPDETSAKSSSHSVREGEGKPLAMTLIAIVPRLQTLSFPTGRSATRFVLSFNKPSTSSSRWSTSRESTC